MKDKTGQTEKKFRRPGRELKVIGGLHRTQFEIPISPASAPEVLELGRCQLGIAHRMLDRLVPEVVLDLAGIVPRIGQRKAAGMPEHVEMNRKPQQFAAVAETFD